MPPDRRSSRSPSVGRRSSAPSDAGERLYRIAFERFRADGFEATPVSALTREAEVAKGTFFNHFPTKEHLLARALDDMLDAALGRALPEGDSDAIARALDFLSLELARAPRIASAIVPRLGLLPPPVKERGDGDGAGITGMERLRRWIGDRLGESRRIRIPPEDTDDRTLSLLILSAFEATLREWIAATGGEPPFPRRLLHGRIAYLLASAGFPHPSTVSG